MIVVENCVADGVVMTTEVWCQNGGSWVCVLTRPHGGSWNSSDWVLTFGTAFSRWLDGGEGEFVWEDGVYRFTQMDEDLLLSLLWSR